MGMRFIWAKKKRKTIEIEALANLRSWSRLKRSTTKTVNSHSRFCQRLQSFRAIQFQSPSLYTTFAYIPARNSCEFDDLDWRGRPPKPSIRTRDFAKYCNLFRAIQFQSPSLDTAFIRVYTCPELVWVRKDFQTSYPYGESTNQTCSTWPWTIRNRSWSDILLFAYHGIYYIAPVAQQGILVSAILWSISWVRDLLSAYSYKFVRTFFLCTNWLAKSAKAWVSNTRWKPTSSGNAEHYAR